MDRHQFVDNLLKNRTELQEQVSNLDSKINRLKTRTFEAIQDRFSTQKDSSINYCNEQGWSCVGSSGSIIIKNTPDNLKVADEHISLLCYEVESLKKQIAQKQEEVEELKSRDFVSWLKREMECP